MNLAALALAFLAGLLLARYLPIPAALWFGLAAAGLAAGALFHRRGRRRVETVGRQGGRVAAGFLLLASLCTGAARFQSYIPLLDNPAFIAAYNDDGATYTITGTLVEPPDPRDFHVNLRVAVEQIRPRDEIRHLSVRGTLLARVDHGTDWQYGDRVTLTGQLRTPPEAEDFSYREYLAREGVYSYIGRVYASGVLSSGGGSPVYGAIYGLKTRALDVIYRIFPDPEASLLAGILLGVETGIPGDLQDAFRDTGTSHIVAISGFNITIIAGIFASLFGRILGVRRGAVAAVIGIGVYTVLVGADAAVVRSAVMGVLVILARQAGRRAAGYRTLVLTAAVMAFANPLILGDVGFQLSFSATLGLLMYGEKMQSWSESLFGRFLNGARAKAAAAPFSEFFLLTIAAQITTLPLIMYYFERVSLSSFLVNPLILPVQPAVMIVGGLVTICGVVSLPLGQALAPVAWIFPAFTIRVVEGMADAPGGVLVLGRVAAPVVVLIYAGLFALELWGARLPRMRDHLPASVSAAGLGLLVFAVWTAGLSAPDGYLHLTFLDVGSGDAVLVQTPDGRRVLIDGGPSTVRLSDALGRRLPLGQRGLDALVVAAPFGPQVEALPRALDRFPPRVVVWAGPEHADRAARRLREALSERGTEVLGAVPGQVVDLGKGAALEVVSVGRRGAVLLLSWHSFKALLPIGMDLEDLDTLEHGRALGPVTVLMLAEGGYAPLAPPGWVRALHPQVAVISVGAGDPQGMPSPETLDALAGYPVLRTDRNGWIHFTTDGLRMWVEAARAP